MAHIEDRWYREVRDADGKVHKEKKDRYGVGKRYRVRYYDLDGNEHNESFEKLTPAKRFLAEVQADEARGVFNDPKAGDVSLRKYSAEWLENQSFGRSSYEVVESRLRLHVWPTLGTHSLAQLARRPSLIQNWVRGLQAAGLAPTYIAAILGHVSTVLKAGVDDGLVARNPCDSSSVKAPKAVPRKVVPWTPSRVEAIRGGMSERYRATVDLGACCGHRQGEVFGLAVADLDRKGKMVRVRRQVKIVGNRLVFAPPKHGREREAPLPNLVVDRLDAHLERFPAVPVTLPWEEPDGVLVTHKLVFTTQRGGAIGRYYYNPYVWRPAVEPVLVKAGVLPVLIEGEKRGSMRDYGFHQLRHSFASVQLDGGTSIRALAEWLGHADPSITLRIYSHLMPDSDGRGRGVIDMAYRYDLENQRADGPMTAPETLVAATEQV
ncbi:site-specific integrase [Allonocardiopsis opalescens]|uniref:Site-specific recombinase XerD n=1 Tax=Allonocardiopsis opalescens TaxID=1144618 RepID=A0A2T0PQ61_9ACTN|nr:site-specific integrase [Allonocardiopsis opalescens]PRX90856.1 site-specific recombinase XerD [Allonocardiopsis opalescens]